MTAWASLETAVQLIKEGASDYLAKPWDDDKLVATVKNLLRMRGCSWRTPGCSGERRPGARGAGRRATTCAAWSTRATRCTGGHAGGQRRRLRRAGADHRPSGAGKEKLAEIVQANSRASRPAVPARQRGRAARGADGERAVRRRGRAPTPAPPAAAWAASRRPTAARCSWTRSTPCRSPARSSCCACCRAASSSAWAAAGPGAADVRIISATNSRPAGGHRRGPLPRGPVLPAERRRAGRAAAGERPEDILPLARHFLARAVRRRVAAPRAVAGGRGGPARHGWPGNVRELENRAAARHPDRRGADDQRRRPGPATTAGAPAAARTRRRPEPRRAPSAAASSGRCCTADGVVARAAERLGLSRQALYRRMDKLGIVLERRPRGPAPRAALPRTFSLAGRLAAVVVGALLALRPPSSAAARRSAAAGRRWLVFTCWPSAHAAAGGLGVHRIAAPRWPRRCGPRPTGSAASTTATSACASRRAPQRRAGRAGAAVQPRGRDPPGESAAHIRQRELLLQTALDRSPVAMSWSTPWIG